MAKLSLEVSPESAFHPGAPRRFVAHLNPETISDGTEASYPSVRPPGSFKALRQWTSTDKSKITFQLLLNEYGVHPEDLNPLLGHMNVQDSLKWLELAQRPVGNPSDINSFSSPPILLLIYGSRQVEKVVLESCSEEHLMFEKNTNRTIRATVNITLARVRKILL